MPFHQPKRSLGQNFLVDPNLQRKIVQAIDPSPDDEVLEIGPGQGALTRHLVGRVRRLVLVEVDDHLAKRLDAELVSRYPSIELIHDDILDVPLHRVTSEVSRLKVIGNIPYNITTPIIFHLLENDPRPACIVLMVQREVADRILARPGGKTYGALAVGVQTVASVERVLHVGRRAFRPSPDVDSTVIRIVPDNPPALEPAVERALRKLTRAAFGQRRKQFQRILRNLFSLTAADVDRLRDRTGLDFQGRPEIFSPDDFVTLTRAMLDAGLLSG